MLTLQTREALITFPQDVKFFLLDVQQVFPCHLWGPAGKLPQPLEAAAALAIASVATTVVSSIIPGNHLEIQCRREDLLPGHKRFS